MSGPVNWSDGQSSSDESNCGSDGSSSPDEINGEPAYIVEKVLQQKWEMEGGVRVRSFLVKWKGFPDDENSWVSEENMVAPGGVWRT